MEEESGKPVSARITVKVHARAKRAGITGRIGEAYKLNVTAPAIEGRANEACVRFFCDLFRVPAGSVRLLHGSTSRLKVIEIAGIDQTTAERRLEA